MSAAGVRLATVKGAGAARVTCSVSVDTLPAASAAVSTSVCAPAAALNRLMPVAKSLAAPNATGIGAPPSRV